MNSCIVLGSVYEEKIRQLGVEDYCTFYTETTVADDTYIKEIDVRQKLKPHDSINVLFLARILEQKGIYIALDAFRRLKERLGQKQGARTFLNIAGDGSELDKVKAYVQKQGMSDVIFSGYVQGREKHDVLTSSHILLFPTFYPEGQPSVNLEAMLYGMPVITRAIAGVPDLLTHGDDGLLTLATDAEVFADFLEQLVRDSALRGKMGWSNHQRALREFVPSQVIPRLLTIYCEALVDGFPRSDEAPRVRALPRQRSA